MNNELKIGDEVKVLTGEFLGETGIINSIYKNNLPFGVKFEGEYFLYWFEEKELEKVEKTKDFQIGDIVETCDIYSGEDQFELRDDEKKAPSFS